MAHVMSVVTGWPAGERRLNLARVIARCEGKLLKAAHHLGIHRSHMYRLVKEYEVWPVVNEARKQRLQKESEHRQKKYRGGIHV